MWAFGAVLFEMLSGQQAFAGSDVSEVLASVLAREPDWTRLPPTVSPVLGTYLRRCLHKDPKQRIPDIAAMRLALEGAFETAVSASSKPAAGSQLQVWQRPVPAVAVALILVAMTGFAVWNVTRPAPERLVRFTVIPPDTAPLALERISPSQRLATLPARRIAHTPHFLISRACA